MKSLFYALVRSKLASIVLLFGYHITKCISACCRTWDENLQNTCISRYTAIRGYSVSSTLKVEHTLNVRTLTDL
jgi:hypothetical protein